jgi:hypothetical protein
MTPMLLQYQVACLYSVQNELFRPDCLIRPSPAILISTLYSHESNNTQSCGGPTSAVHKPTLCRMILRIAGPLPAPFSLQLLPIPDKHYHLSQARSCKVQPRQRHTATSALNKHPQHAAACRDSACAPQTAASDSTASAALCL